MQGILDFLSNENLLDILISAFIVVIAGVTGRLAAYFFEDVVVRWTGRTRTNLDDLLIRTARTPLFFVIVLVGVHIGLLRLAFLPDAWLDFFREAIYVAYVMVGYVFSYRLIRDGLRWYTRSIAERTDTRLDDEVLPFFRRLLLVVLSGIVFVMLLQHFGYSITGIVATLGVGSLAIALAAQSTLADAIAGFVILLDRPYRVGDRIMLPEEIDGLYANWGEVHRITLRSTRVRSTDGVVLIVPNSWMLDNTVVNFGHEYDPRLRVRIRVGVEPDWPNVKKAMRVIERVTSSRENVLDKPRPPQVVLREIRDFDILIEVRFWVASPRLMRQTKSDIIEDMLETFEVEGVQTAYPLQRIHLLEDRQIQDE